MELEEAIKVLKHWSTTISACDIDSNNRIAQALERILKYIKEESIPRAELERELDYQNMLWNTPNKQKEYNQELASFLEEILNKGE